MIESKIAVCAVLGNRSYAGIFQFLAYIQKLNPCLRFCCNACFLKSVLIVEDTTYLRLLYNRVQIAFPCNYLIIQTRITKTVIVHSCCHIGQVICIIPINIGDTLIVIFEDIKLVISFQRSGQNLVDVTPLPFNVNLHTRLLFKSISRFLNHQCLGFAGCPHRPHR